MDGGKMNVVWFSVDALRSDIVLEYLRRNPGTWFSSFLSRGIIYEKVFTNACYTVGSMYSVMTGFYPNITRVDTQHGEESGQASALIRYNHDLISFPEILKGEGYYNTLLWANTDEACVPPYGFDVFQLRKWNEGWVRHVCYEDLEHYNRIHDQPKYLHVHFMRIHDDACAYSERNEWDRRHYLESVHRVGEDVRKVYERLDPGNTVVAVTGDHGWAVKDDPGATHRKLNPDVRLMALLGIFHPQWKAQRISAMIRGIDIMPTLLDFLGFRHDFTQGISQKGLTRDERRDERFTAFAGDEAKGAKTGLKLSKPNLCRWIWDRMYPGNRRNRLRMMEEKILRQSKTGDRTAFRAIRTHRWKYLKMGILFDLKNDPYETKDVSSEHPDTVRWLRDELSRIESAHFDAKAFYAERCFPHERYLGSRSVPVPSEGVNQVVARMIEKARLHGQAAQGKH